jgi:hypothetical protein
MQLLYFLYGEWGDEENLLRKQLTLIEQCTALGKAKEAYLKMYPETAQGKALKKLPGTGRIPYALVARQMLGKSKSTVEKYLQIYSALIEPGRLGDLPTIDHPVLKRVEDLSALASSKGDIPALVEILYTDSDMDTPKFCSLHNAKLKLSQRKKEEEALRQAQKALQNQPTQRTPTTENQESDQGASPGGTTVEKTTADQPSEQGSGTEGKEDGVDTAKPEVLAGVDPAQNEGLHTTEEVVVTIEQHIRAYVDVQEPHKFARFMIETEQLEANELYIVVKGRTDQNQVTPLSDEDQSKDLHGKETIIA